MGINIRSINVTNLGPINELNWNLGGFNLVYGHNEKGKSYLVEFIIRSLFKESGWNLREKVGSGKIRVEGLEDDLVDFSPSKKKKLKDYLSKDNKYIGLPPDFSKLLIIKGTKVELGEGDDSPKLMLRRYLSNKEILDRIVSKGNIQITVQEVEIDRYSISGSEKGLLKNRIDSLSELEKIDEIYQEIEGKYLGGELRQLKDRKDDLQVRYDALDKAKRYHAYEISKEIKQLREKLESINEKAINKLLDRVKELDLNEKQYEDKKNDYETLRESTSGYEWLKNAIDLYKEYNLDSLPKKPSIGILVFFIMSLIGSGILFALDSQIGGVIALIMSALIGAFYKWRYDRALANYGKNDELQKLEGGYKERFEDELENLSNMKERLSAMEEDYGVKNSLKRELESLKKEIKRKQWEIGSDLKELLKEKIERQKWIEKLGGELEKRNEIEREINEKEKKLAELQVDESEYIEEEPKSEYNKKEFEKVDSKLTDAEKKIEKKEEELVRVKQRICDVTGDDISSNWNELLGSLAEKRRETLNDYKEYTASIIGQNYVSEVIKKLYEEEDEKIKAVLDSNIIKEMLPKVTGHYEDISLDGDNMIVSDSYHDFSVSEISDGAKEQVFLALRIGFAKHWFSKDELFLIFDDVFLHSDYKRRPKLLDKVLELAESGWQIICFTFDDNIKQLIDKKASGLQNRYEFFDLNET